MTKKNRQFIHSAIIFIVALVIIDFMVGKVGDYAITKLPDYAGNLAKDNFRLNRVKTDIVILGSSRACHHYVTTMLKDSIDNYTGNDYSMYNGGIRWRFVNANSCAAESIMDRYSPKMIIFEIRDGELSGENAYHDIRVTSALYTTNRFVKQYMDALGWEQRVKCISNLFRYSKVFPGIVASFIQQESDSTGYEPLFQEMHIIPAPEKETETIVDGYSLENFTRIIQIAKTNGVQLIVTTSPFFRSENKNPIVSDICLKYDVPYIDLQNLELFNLQPTYFKDEGHLNDKGARIFTAIFFDQLKPYLSESGNR